MDIYLPVTEMATRKEKENVNKKETNDFLCEILKRINFIEEKMEESNVLMKELIKVCAKALALLQVMKRM